jgi:hypothetical protein
MLARPIGMLTYPPLFRPALMPKRLVSTQGMLP